MLTFAVVADDPTVLHEVAAFPGGFLFVPASLILAVRDEDELAGVLASAIAHVASRDATRQATKAELIDTSSVPVMYFGGWTGYPTLKVVVLAADLSDEHEAERLLARVFEQGGAVDVLVSVMRVLPMLPLWLRRKQRPTRPLGAKSGI